MLLARPTFFQPGEQVFAHDFTAVNLIVVDIAQHDEILGLMPSPEMVKNYVVDFQELPFSCGIAHLTGPLAVSAPIFVSLKNLVVNVGRNFTVVFRELIQGFQNVSVFRQAVAGQMQTFFAELGFHFPQFPFIAHSRGWSAEDMERNVEYVRNSPDLREGAQALAARAIDTAKMLIGRGAGCEKRARAGRKATPINLKPA